jgi:hypothetical protein
MQLADHALGEFFGGVTFNPQPFLVAHLLHVGSNRRELGKALADSRCGSDALNIVAPARHQELKRNTTLIGRSLNGMITGGRGRVEAEGSEATALS